MEDTHDDQRLAPPTLPEIDDNDSVIDKTDHDVDAINLGPSQPTDELNIQRILPATQARAEPSSGSAGDVDQSFVSDLVGRSADKDNGADDDEDRKSMGLHEGGKFPDHTDDDAGDDAGNPAVEEKGGTPSTTLNKTKGDFYADPAPPKDDSEVYMVREASSSNKCDGSQSCRGTIEKGDITFVAYWKDCPWGARWISRHLTCVSPEVWYKVHETIGNDVRSLRGYHDLPDEGQQLVKNTFDTNTVTSINILRVPELKQLIGFFGGGLNSPGTKAQLVSRITDAFAEAKLEIEGTPEELLERAQKYHETMDKGEAKEADAMHERMVEQVAEGQAELIDGVEDDEEQTDGNNADSVSGAGPSTRSRTNGTKRKRASTPNELPKNTKRVKMTVTPMTPNKKATIATKKTPPARPKATKTRPPQAQGTRWSSRLHRRNTESENGESSAEELEPSSVLPARNTGLKTQATSSSPAKSTPSKVTSSSTAKART